MKATRIVINDKMESSTDMEAMFIRCSFENTKPERNKVEVKAIECYFDYSNMSGLSEESSYYNCTFRCCNLGPGEYYDCFFIDCKNHAKMVVLER